MASHVSTDSGAGRPAFVEVHDYGTVASTAPPRAKNTNFDHVLTPDGTTGFCVVQPSGEYSNTKSVYSGTWTGTTFGGFSEWEDLSAWLHGQTRSVGSGSTIGLMGCVTDTYIWLMVRNEVFSGSGSSYTWTVYAKPHSGGSAWAGGTDNGYGWVACSTTWADSGSLVNRPQGNLIPIENDCFVFATLGLASGTGLGNAYYTKFDSSGSGSFSTVATLPSEPAGAFGPYRSQIAIGSRGNGYTADVVWGFHNRRSSADGTNRVFVHRADISASTVTEYEVYNASAPSTDDQFDPLLIVRDPDDSDAIWSKGYGYRWTQDPDDQGWWWFRYRWNGSSIDFTDAEQVSWSWPNATYPASDDDDDDPLYISFDGYSQQPDSSAGGPWVAELERWEYADEWMIKRWPTTASGWVLNRMAVA